MGREITSQQNEQNTELFKRRLVQQLQQLKEIINQPDFGQGPLSIGAELETNIIDKAGRASHCNQWLIDTCQDPRQTLELNRYNLEFNLTPQPAKSMPFSLLAKEIKELMELTNQIAEQRQKQLVSIGILPTLTDSDLSDEAISDVQRYKLFSTLLLKDRGEPFQLNIDGNDPFKISTKSIAFEGAGTSFQLHIRVPKEKFSNIYNAIQLITAPVLAYCGNSPSLLGHELWDETRIALFKQSIDTRNDDKEWSHPPRVVYGQDWNRHGIWELFAANTYLYEPIFAQIYNDTDKSNSQLPKLDELQLHQGTVWSWNRGIYDHHDNGHLRIELRTLPAGPTIADMMANAAVMTGLAYGLADDIEDYLVKLPFKYAEYNFYRAAKHGMDAKLIWPSATGFGLTEQSPDEILKQLWPKVRQGLQHIGVDDIESARWLSIFEKRWQANTSGARWQRQRLHYLKSKLSGQQALHQMLKDYLHFQRQDIPVSEWPVES
ncbi:glutamate--cysteine ligase [Thalassotalea sp. PS06]|uniref:glutamate--cysteine ligase n=1 Tax=Thalassotalea sp. PS06 TaxID=2594005 RepID=UPI00163D4B62|nr:glutamate--cysteine ligase [Thalassotalea sp. PS06]